MTNDTAAKKLYAKHTDNHPTIHCNRFPGWDELSENERDDWRAKVVPDERTYLRAQQAAAVMPQIGPLLDAWEGIDNDTKGTIREDAPELAKWLGSINRAMTGDSTPTHQG